MATRIRPQIRKFAESMELHAREKGLHGDTDQSCLYARAKEGLAVIADNILTDGAGLVDSCANMANIMMMLVCPSGDFASKIQRTDEVSEENNE